MSTLNKVIWAEGVFLGQQHFQQWDRYIDERERFITSSLNPLGWGVKSLIIDEEALLNGQFQVKHCQVIFSNLDIINYNTQYSPTLSLNLSGKPGEIIEIYLCIPDSRVTHGITGYENSGKLPTWMADYKDIYDDFDPERKREVMFGQPNLLLLTGDQAKEGLVSIKLAEVVNEGINQYQCKNTFIPPVLHIRSSSALENGLRRTIELVSSKVRILRERDVTQDVTSLLLQKELNSLLPLLHDCYQNLDFHPHYFYIFLARAIGALSTFTSEDTSSIPLYEHDQLSETFRTLENQFTKLLEVVMPSAMSALNFKRENDNIYTLDNIDSHLFLKNSFFLEVQFTADDPQWMTNFSRQVKVGSRAILESLVSSALPGVKLTHVQRAPNKLPIRTGCEYFYFEPHGEFWEQVKSDRTLALFLSHEFINARVSVVTIEE